MASFMKNGSQVIIPEIDVLIGATLWLSSRQVVLYEFSIARGQGIDMEADKLKLNTALDSKRILTEQRSFVGYGQILPLSDVSIGRSNVKVRELEGQRRSGITLTVPFRALFHIIVNLHQTMVMMLSTVRVRY